MKTKTNPFKCALREIRLKDLRDPRSLQVKLMVAAMMTPALMQAVDAYAQQGSVHLPWAAPICRVATSLQGEVAHGIAIIVLVVTGLLLAFGETGGIFKTAIGVVFGLSFALLATSMIQKVFPESQFTNCPLS